MSWRVYSGKDLAILIDFLKIEEWRCVPFADRIRESITTRWAKRPSFHILVNENEVNGRGAIGEAIMFTKHGLALPLLNDRTSCMLMHNRKFKAFFNRYENRLHSIMGPQDSVVKMERLFEKQPKKKIDYYLMALDLTRYQPRRVKLGTNLTARLAGQEDANRLYSLQKQYELEEVLLNPTQFDENRCRTHLRKNLKKQVVFVAELDGLPISKAGTNARGFYVDQIGGVFTKAGLRNRGYAAWIMEALLEYLKTTRRMVTLFVKMDNRSAINLYKKLDFEIKRNFRISYYLPT
jgi:predicted GNAT family acetyltransferase